MMKNKKALSEVIGYVLLISFAIILSGIVYYWMKSYIPSDEVNCPDGVSVFIENYECTSTTINLTIKNNGKFNIEGYFIRGTNESNQEVATIDLSKYADGIGGVVRFEGGNFLETGDESEKIFNLAGSGISNIYSIEIVPVRSVVIDNKKKLAICSDAKIKEEIKNAAGLTCTFQ